jgi:hypothetical protein
MTMQFHKEKCENGCIRRGKRIPLSTRFDQITTKKKYLSHLLNQVVAKLGFARLFICALDKFLPVHESK